jgi:hypothetical protein
VSIAIAIAIAMAVKEKKLSLLLPKSDKDCCLLFSCSSAVKARSMILRVSRNLGFRVFQPI